jgi:hypothetical protein
MNTTTLAMDVEGHQVDIWWYGRHLARRLNLLVPSLDGLRPAAATLGSMTPPMACPTYWLVGERRQNVQSVVIR